MVRFLFLLLILLFPIEVGAQGIERFENGSAQVCRNFDLACASPPCFPWGPEGIDFSGANTNYYVTINVTAGSPSIELEGKAKGGGSHFALATFTTGFDGYLLRSPQIIRIVINSGATGKGVICAHN